MQANPKKGSTRLPFIYFVILFLYQQAICKSLQHDKRTRLLHGKHDLDNASLFSNRQLIVDVRGIFQSGLTHFCGHTIIVVQIQQEVFQNHHRRARMGS
jgi:hypothetical protein